MTEAGPPNAPSLSDLREWLSGVADHLIPAAYGMPAASSMSVAGGQLDAVVDARPDLLPLLIRAYSGGRGAPWQETVTVLAETDGEALEAVLLAVAGAYYAHPEVRRLLGYTGQVPEEVKPDTYPKYVDEGLIERVISRYRARPVP